MSFSSSNSSKEAVFAATTNGGTSGIGGDNNDEESSYMVIKGKRTKRQRIQQLGLPTATTASSTTTTSAGSYTSTTEEEEDMANCLILLAQGPKVQPRSMVPEKVGGSSGGGTTPKVSSRRYVEQAMPTDEKVGFYMYECKTCNKRFPSFQALGGHRTSHTKPKMVAGGSSGGGPSTDGKKSMDEDFSLEMSIAPSYSKPIAATNNTTTSSNAGGGSKPRVHECSICGSEFSSGQALGGHMRRHRPMAVPSTTKLPLEPKKKKSLLPLDLNLPAPSDEDQEDFTKSSPSSPTAAFPFSPGAKPSVLFSSLVDCHY